MMKGRHSYKTNIYWTGNKGTGTANYRAFERSYIVSIENKPDISGSSDPSFRGDKTKYNPEELLVASLASCHMLWYLHLCSVNGVVVTDYNDTAIGTLVETSDGGGYFREVNLHPVVMVEDSSMIEKATGLHKIANSLCFIANSVNFKVEHSPRCLTGKG